MEPTTVWGLVVLVLSTVCWVGQVISWLAPERATAAGLTEAEANVEPAFWADGRGEARWDSFTLWVMVVAGLMLLVGSSAWPYFGLVGGGMYVYFAGRGIAVRREMSRTGLRIGDSRSVRIGLVALAVWGLMASIAIVAATVSLRGA